MNSISLLILQLLAVDSLSIVQACNFPKQVISGFLAQINSAADSFLGGIKKITSQIFGLKAQENSKSPSPKPKIPPSQQPQQKIPESPQGPLPSNVPNKPKPAGSLDPQPSPPPSPAAKPASLSPLKPSQQPPPSTPSPPQSPVSYGRPIVPPPPLNIEPKYLSRIDEKDTDIKWNQIKRADHYTVEIVDFYYQDGSGNRRVVHTIPKNETKFTTRFVGGGLFGITVSAFRSSDESILITEERSYIIVINEETSKMKITKPPLDGNQERKEKKGDWELEWEQVPRASKYSVVVIRNKEPVYENKEGAITKTNIRVTSGNSGGHDIFLFAWKTTGTDGANAVTWGTGFVNVVDEN